MSDWWNPLSWFEKEESRLEDFELPEYYEDPDYRETQDFLKDLGINILGGEIPDYFSAIGETGSDEFENYLNLMTGDIKSAGLEAAAALGQRGGGVMDSINQQVGEYSTQSRYADFMRALEGKSWLFDQGRGITEGVRSAGQAEGAKKNAFNLDVSKLDWNTKKYLDEYDLNQDLMSGGNFADLISRGAGAVVGASTGGWTGALAGAMGGTDWTQIFNDAAQEKTKKALETDESEKLEYGKINPGDEELARLLTSIRRS